jgi:hypothetical protein
MLSNQSYSIQREQLMQLKHFLQQFDIEIQQRLSEYKQRIASLRETGLPIETAEKFASEMILETENCIRKNSDYIKDDAIPLLNKNIEILEELLGERKLGTRIAAFVGAGVATVAGAAALGFQKDNKDYNTEVPSAHHSVSDNPKKTPWDIVQEMAEDIHDVLEAGTYERKRSDEIKEQSKPYPETEQEENKDA